MHRRSHQIRRDTLRSRPRVVRLLAMLTMEILFQHELPLANDQNPMVLLRCEGIDGGVYHTLNEFLYRSSRHADLFKRCGRPAVIQLRWLQIRIPYTGAPAGIEVRAFIRIHPSKFVVAATVCKIDRQGVVSIEPFSPY